MSRTSWIRSADAAARGTMTNMITAIITENRICMTYWRNAIRLPICMLPPSTWIAPNHRIATLDRLKMAMTVGIISANRRLTRSAVWVRSRLASSKRRSSCSVRTKARMTRIPDSVSRMTWLIRSTLTCITRNSGSARDSISPMNSPRSGMITMSSADSSTSSRTAMITPPTAMIGARIITFSAMTRTIWTCWTSFVLRVIRVGGPNRFVSAWEKARTFWKMAARTSRPNAIAVFADQ